MSLVNLTKSLKDATTSVALRWRFRRVHLGTKVPLAIPPKKRRIGTVVSDAIYQVAHECAYARFITQMAVIFRDADHVTLELCHTWRITRDNTDLAADSVHSRRWSFTRWNPTLGRWEDIEAAQLPPLTIFQRGRISLAKELIQLASTHYVYRAVDALRADFERLGYDEERIADGAALAAEILCKDRLRHKERFESLAGAGSVVGAALWQLLDRPSASHAFRIYPIGELRLQEYITVEQSRAALDRIYREHRRAMPILSGIHDTYWHDVNLFAHYRWADAKTAPLAMACGHVISSKLAWKAFINAPAPAHAAWMRARRGGSRPLPFALLYEVLGRCRRKPKVVWIAKVVSAFRMRKEWFYEVGAAAEYTSLSHLCDAFFAYASTLSPQPGASVSRQLDPDAIANVLDWWADDGRTRLLPDAQSTWSSISRQVKRWEQAKRDGDPHKRWRSAIDTTQIDDVQVTPLLSEFELVREGREMHHCVGTYADVCMTHGHRIFSLRSGTARSTLRILPHGGKWVVGENSAECNAAPASALVSVGKKVAAAYALACASALPADEDAGSPPFPNMHPPLQGAA